MVLEVQSTTLFLICQVLPACWLVRFSAAAASTQHVSMITERLENGFQEARRRTNRG